MIDIVIPLICTGAFIVFVHKAKKRGEIRFDSLISTWEGNLLTFVKDNGLEDIDLEFMNSADLKKKSDATEIIKFIGSELNKGFDLIDCTHHAGYYFGPHQHKNSSEFFYVISGKVRITVCNNPADECMKCDGGCGLDGARATYEFNDEIILNPGEFFLVEQNRFHTFESLEDSNLIVIAIPPIGRLPET